MHTADETFYAQKPLEGFNGIRIREIQLISKFA